MDFFTSDTHFFHKNIIKYEDRPFRNIEEMNTTLINNWNWKITKNDNVYILGDFSFGSEDETIKLLNILNGNKFLIKGNHDKVVKNRDVANKFGWIRDYYMLRQGELKIALFHYPIQVWDCRHHNALHFYGHIHSNKGNHAMEYNIPNSYNVGVDVNNFEPMSLQEIKNKIQSN